MNIFVFNTNAVTAAQQHCDKHVVKMILESAQMLSTVHRVIAAETGEALSPAADAALYRSTHENHPCSIWARQTRTNYNWLYAYFAGLSARYTVATGNYHKSWQELRGLLSSPPPGLTAIGLTPFAQAMPDKYKHSDPTVAYQRYFNGEKQHIAMWTYNETPRWATQYDGKPTRVHRVSDKNLRIQQNAAKRKQRKAIEAAAFQEKLASRPVALQGRLKRAIQSPYKTVSASPAAVAIRPTKKKVNDYAN